MDLTLHNGNTTMLRTEFRTQKEPEKIIPSSSDYDKKGQENKPARKNQKHSTKLQQNYDIQHVCKANF